MVQTRNAQQARKLARERRAQLDADRATRDKRIEQAITDTILALQARDDAVAAQHDAEASAGNAMRQLTQENLRTDDVATLCDVPEALVKRLTVLAARAEKAEQQDNPIVIGHARTARINPLHTGPLENEEARTATTNAGGGVESQTDRPDTQSQGRSGGADAATRPSDRAAAAAGGR